MTLRWSEDGVAEVADVAELERVLNRVREELGSGSAAPRFVELHNPPHGFMHLGIGAPYTVLSYMAEHEAGPYYVSRGEPGRLADVPEIVAFDYGGHESEFPAASAVTFDEGLSAFLEFAATGRRSTKVGWDQP